MRLTVSRAASILGELRPPSDKSLTHRAYLLGAVAEGRSVVRSPLRGEDCEATLRCLAAMGLRFERSSDGEVRLDPAATWAQPHSPLDCGNSGTTMRLLAGLVASRPIQATLVGDASLSRRPMKRIADPLRRMGAGVEGDTPPLTILGSASLQGIRHESPVASAQIKSCVLLAGLRAEGETWVREPFPSRDHTERMLEACGVEVLRGAGVGVRGGAKVAPFEFTVPADISSAAFFLCAAAVIPGSRVMMRGVGVNPTRSGVLDALAQAGVAVRLSNERVELGEPVADIGVEAPDQLRPFEISGALVPRLIDEIPVLAVLATQCEGVSTIRDASELRVKESDRIAKIAEGLRSMGARVETFDDGLSVEGPTPLSGGLIDAAGDHRIAMAFAVAGLAAEGQTAIEGVESIATSYPGFEADLRSLTTR